MGFSNTSGCSSMPDYETCDKHFMRTPLPRGKAWGTAERPLSNARQHHYRIEKHDSPARITYSGEHVPAADFYDACLYHTVMARYHKPLEDGSRCIEYTNHGSNLSRQFKWRVTRMSDVMTYGDVRVPIAFKELGTTIWLDAHGTLIQEKSSHQPVYKYVTSQAQKDWRKVLKASTRNLAMLLEIGMEQDATYSPQGWHHAGVPFKGNEDGVRLIRRGYDAPLRHWDGELTVDTTVTIVGTLQQLWTTCHEHLLAKRDYADNTAPVLPAEVTRSWYGMLDRLNPYFKDSERIPDFPTADQLPSKFHF